MIKTLFVVLAVLAIGAFADDELDYDPNLTIGSPFNGLVATSYFMTGTSVSYVQGSTIKGAPKVVRAAYDAHTGEMALNIYDSTGTIIGDFNYWNATGNYFTAQGSFLALGNTAAVYQANLAKLLLTSFEGHSAVYVGLASDPTSGGNLAHTFFVSEETGVFNNWTFTEPFCAEVEPGVRFLILETVAITFDRQHLRVPRGAERNEFVLPANFGVPSTDLSPLQNCPPLP